MRLGILCFFCLAVAACAHADAPGPRAVHASPPALDAGGEPALLQRAGIAAGSLACNRDNRWGGALRGDSQAGAAELLQRLGPSLLPLSDEARARLVKQLEGILFWRMVRAVIIEGDNNNFGVLALRGRTWKDDAGAEHPVLIFRTGLTPNPDAAGSCFASLLDAGHVRHVVNVFDGDIPAADLVAAESRAAGARGASYHSANDDGDGGYGPWRDLLRKRYDDPASRAQASRAVARLIREQILLPGGAPPRGNLHLHCGGGMHRTGMLAGLVERCVNGEPMSVVEEHYKEHVGYRDAAHPGGYEAGNVTFVRDFDCGLLQAN